MLKALSLNVDVTAVYICTCLLSFTVTAFVKTKTYILKYAGLIIELFCAHLMPKQTVSSSDLCHLMTKASFQDEINGHSFSRSLLRRPAVTFSTGSELEKEMTHPGFRCQRKWFLQMNYRFTQKVRIIGSSQKRLLEKSHRIFNMDRFRICISLTSIARGRTIYF